MSILEMSKPITKLPSKETENEAILDVDGTLTREFAFFSFIRAQADVGLIRKDAAVLSAVRRMENGYAGEYEKALGHVLVQHARDLEGQSESDVQEHANEFYRAGELWLPFSKPTIKELGKRNFEITIVSGGAHFAVEAAARFLEVRRSFSTRYSTDKDEQTGKTVFTGKLDYDLATSSKKGEIVRELRKKLYYKNPAGITLYCGDSDGDIFALHIVDGAFVVRPSEQLKRRSWDCGWSQIPEEELNRAEIPKTITKELERLQKRRLLVINSSRIWL